MSQVTTLFKLQEIEQKINIVRARLAEIDTILANDEAIHAANHAITQAEAVLPPLQKRSRELEHELESNLTKAQATEDRLYSGNVKNPKEMQDMQKEFASLKNQQQQLEDEMLMLMEKIDTAEDTLQNRQDELEQVKRTQGSKHDLLLAEQETKQKELRILQNQRLAAHDALSQESIDLYERLKPRTRGLAVTRMHNDGTCGACGVQQNQSVEKEIRRGSMEQCSNCRRILVFL